jgi:hypothetical protein
VLLRHALGRAWASWLVKIAAFTAWLPLLIGGAYVVIIWYASNQLVPPGQEGAPPPGASSVQNLIGFQFWFFATLVTVGAGASAIAEDIAFKAFSFYFAKPVTPPQYLIGRTAAVAFWVFMVTLVPAWLFVLVIVGISPEDLRLEQTGLLLPSLFHSVLISVVMAAGSVGISSLSGSRALTMTSWIVLLVLPHILAGIVNAIAQWPWLYLISIPELLSVVGDALFKIEPDTELRWYHAAPILALVSVGGVALAYRRVKSVEVIA